MARSAPDLNGFEIAVTDFAHPRMLARVGGARRRVRGWVHAE